jgi:heme exporter protein A
LFLQEKTRQYPLQIRSRRAKSAGLNRAIHTSGGRLRGRDLTVWRGERCLFEALDFEIGRGELALVLGPNGSGKTTLLRVLAGLASPTAGSVTWDGVTVEGLAPEQRAAIVYRGHLDGLKRELTVRENLRFHAALWHASSELDVLLAELSLTGAAETRARYLSAGQRRRAGLATLKLCSAELWILDEPLTNLDREGRALVVGWVQQHLQNGGAAVIATHQPDEFATPGTLSIELH